VSWIEQLTQSRVYHRWAPERPWGVAQTEQDVLFLHYQVDADALRRLVPSVFDLQMPSGNAWVGIMALTMADVQFRAVPFRLPRAMRRFPEVDLVTYVSYQGRKGVYFFSIESARRWLSPPVRWSTGLPYLYSGLRIDRVGDSVQVTSGPRSCQGAATAVLDLTYCPRQGGESLDPDSPIRELVEQFSAFGMDASGRVCELDEVHEPWDVVDVDVDIRANTLGLAVDCDLPQQPTLAHYARERHILSWPAAQVRAGRPGLAPIAPRG
jgi:uncharacterized protein